MWSGWGGLKLRARCILLRMSLTTGPGHTGQTSWRLQNRGGVSLESDFYRFCFRHRQPASRMPQTFPLPTLFPLPRHWRDGKPSAEDIHATVLSYSSEVPAPSQIQVDLASKALKQQRSSTEKGQTANLRQEAQHIG